jgi:phosphomannomutase
MFRLFELMVLTKKTFEELLAMVPIKISSPEFRIACHSDEVKESIINDVKKYFATKPDSELITIDGIRAHMHYGWGLARASNTQPVICLRFESDCQDGLARVKNDFFTVLKMHFDEQVLRESIEL